MYTHQELMEYNRIYNAYKDHRILFSSQVSRSLGLQQQDTILKIGMDQTKGALVSASMNDLVILASLDDSFRRKIHRENGLITVHLRFYDSLFKKEMIFNLYTKFLNINSHGLNHDGIHYVTLLMRRKLPNELISVFGKHHEKLKSAKNSLAGNRTAFNRKVEGMLFVRGVKKACFPAMIDGRSVLINYLGDPAAFLNHKAMVVLKSVETGDVFEIIGRVDEEAFQQLDSFQFRLNYSLEQQSPRFAQSYRMLASLINEE